MTKQQILTLIIDKIEEHRELEGIPCHRAAAEALTDLYFEIINNSIE